jgi:predicted bacteriocin transport accessory protein
MKNKNSKSSTSTKWIVIIFAAVLILSVVITEILAADDSKMNISSYIKELSSENESLILLSNDKCTECNQINKVLEKIQTNEKISVYELNVEDLNKDDLDVLLKSSDLIDTDNLPMVLHMSAGAIIGAYTEEVNYDDLLAFAKVYKEITVKEYLELVKEDEENFIYIGRPTCGYCVKSQPLSKRISYEMNKDIYYINIDEETASDLKLLETETNGIYRGSTPLFMITKNGEIVNSQEGARSYTDLNSFFNGTNN